VFGSTIINVDAWRPRRRGSGDTFFTSLTSYFQDHVISSVLLLLALLVGVGMLIRWGVRVAKK